MKAASQPPGPRGPRAALANLLTWKHHGLALMAEMVDAYGDLSLFDIGPYPVCLVNDPALIQSVLVEHHDKLRKPEALVVSNRGHWGDGLTSLDGASWRKRKRLMAPLFQRAEVTRWGHEVVGCTQEMIARWRTGLEFRPFDELLDLRSRIAARTLFSAEVPGDISLAEARGETFVLTRENCSFPYLGMRRPRAGADARDIPRLIEQRVKQPDARQDALAALLQLCGRENGLSRDELRDELLQMYFAGHLTVTTWLTRVWYVLALRSELEAALTEELERVLAGRPPSPADLPELRFCSLLLKETGRYFAPAPLLYREIDTPFTLGGYLLEADTGLWICPQLLHHDPRNFPKPHEFRPERFDPDRGQRPPEYSYLPFGAGPRVCIGRAAALMEMQLVVATVYQAYRLLAPHADPRGPLDAPPVGLFMRAEQRV